MAEPKKKLSKTRTSRRRAEYKIAAPTFSLCTNCAKPNLAHTVCPHCGYYNNKPILSKTPTKRIVLDSETSDAK